MKRYAIQKRIFLIMLCLLMLTLTACSTRYNSDGAETTAPTAEGRNKPLLWRVDGAKGSIYLFGSIHVATEDIYPLDGFIEDAFDECDYLAVEIDMVTLEERMLSDAAFAAEIAPYLYYTDGSTIETMIGTELFNKAKELLLAQDGKYPEAMLNMGKPYMWISMLSSLGTEKAELSEEMGVDLYFIQQARDEGKTVLEVESIYSQLELFESFSPETVKMLISGSLSPSVSALGLQVLYGYWKTGNSGAMDMIFDGQRKTSPDYYDAMFTQRNIHMADVAEEYLDKGQKTFYVVGLGHMLGDGGIVDLLTQRGYTVELME